MLSSWMSAMALSLHGSGFEARRGEGHDDAPERLERCGAVDFRRLLQLPRNLAEVRREEPDRQRQCEREVRDDQPRPGVVEPDAPPDIEQRADDRDLGEDGDCKRGAEDEPFAGEVESRDGVGRSRRQQNGDERADRRNADRVAERRREHVLVEDVAVVVPRGRSRDEAAVGEVCRAFQRERDDPDEGHERVHADDNRGNGPERFFAQLTVHQASPRCWARLAPKTLTKMTAMMTTQMKMRTEIAEPMPRFNRLRSWL